MNKMMAIINEPDDCLERPLLHYRSTSFKCGLNNEWMKQIDLTKRPDWCELKSFSETIEGDNSIKYQ